MDPVHKSLDRPRRSLSPPRTVPKGPYGGLCIGGGAAAGYQFLGCLHYFYTETVWMKGVRVYGGTSIGASISTFLALGFSPMELFQMMMTYDLDDIMSFDLTHLPGKWGLVDNDKWKKYITQMILLKWSYVPTLQEVFDQTGNILCITTWCMTQKPHAVYLTPQTHPDVLVSDAIVMSTNLPCIFTKMEYKGHLYIDGGIFDNCPTKKTESLLDREERLLVVRLSDYSVPYTIDSLTDYLKSILEIFHRSQTCPTPEQGDEIVLKPELGAMTLRVEKKVRTEIFQRVFKRIKYQLFIPKVKKE